jgi:hypothetical protein
VEAALKMSNTEYTWLLGDSSLMQDEGLEYVYELISNNKKYEVIIVNQCKDGVKGIPEKDYSDRNQLLSDLGWHMTLISSYIFSKSIMNCGDFKRYYDSHFVHMGITFEYIADKDFLVHWIDKPIVYRIQKMDGEYKRNSTGFSGFEVWTRIWSNFVFSLPVSYSLEAKLKSIMDFSEKTITFSIRDLLNKRSLNEFNYKIYKQYSQIFPFTIKYPKLIIFLISLFPIKFLLLLKKIYYDLNSLRS